MPNFLVRKFELFQTMLLPFPSLIHCRIFLIFVDFSSQISPLTVSNLIKRKSRLPMTTPSIYTVSKKLCKIISFQNFVKFPPILVIFGRQMAKKIKSCEVNSFSTSPNSCHHTTVLNADVSNC